jgi:hypothetical protein
MKKHLSIFLIIGLVFVLVGNSSAFAFFTKNEEEKEDEVDYNYIGTEFNFFKEDDAEKLKQSMITTNGQILFGQAWEKTEGKFEFTYGRYYKNLFWVEDGFRDMITLNPTINKIIFKRKNDNESTKFGVQIEDYFHMPYENIESQTDYNRISIEPYFKTQINNNGMIFKLDSSLEGRKIMGLREETSYTMYFRPVYGYQVKSDKGKIGTYISYKYSQFNPKDETNKKMNIDRNIAFEGDLEYRILDSIKTKLETKYIIDYYRKGNKLDVNNKVMVVPKIELEKNVGNLVILAETGYEFKQIQQTKVNGVEVDNPEFKPEGLISGEIKVRYKF